MIRLAIAALIALAAAGGWYALVDGPRKLSQLDWLAGGSHGVEQVGSGIPFGTHGQQLDVWRPAGGASTEKRPLVVFFYGGGWHSGTRQGYAFAARALAARGFVVVVPDYRKVPAVRFPAFVVDGAEAVRWARDHAGDYGGDAQRMALMGHSAGAHIAALLALDPRYLFAQCMDPRMIRAVVGLSGPYDFFPFTSESATAAFADWPKPRETQPIAFARADAPPMLLATSDADTTVKPRNATALRDKLHKLGAMVEFRDYGSLSHEDVVMALSKPFRDKAPVLADSVAFLNRVLARPKDHRGQP